jgi:hypothetical protein
MEYIMNELIWELECVRDAIINADIDIDCRAIALACIVLSTVQEASRDIEVIIRDYDERKNK